MNRAVGFMSAVGVGAGLMYLFDPDRGKRRRGEIRDAAKHVNRIATDAAGKTGRDIQNRLHGVISEVERLFRTETVTDDILEARVRSTLGRFVSHPHAIEVKAVEGLITLSGSILTAEVHPLLEAVASIDGVKNIRNYLETYDSPGDIPGLQGGRRRQGKRFGLFKTSWSPTTRLIASVTGGALAMYGGKRRGVIGSAAGTLGLGLVTRALTNLETRRLVGMDRHTGGIDIEKTITIDAPVDKVFTYWSRPENFPEFMTHIREVSRLQDSIYHWKVGGPAGLLVEWDAAITELEPNEMLAWKSLPNSIIGQTGVTRFTSNPDGSTRLDLKMSYQPPAGILGHEIARLFGSDPKHEIDDDLMRMKSFIETGVKPHDAAVQLEHALAR